MIKYWTHILLLFVISGTLAREKQLEFRVSYISAENVYLDGGKAEGLRVGDQLEIHRNRRNVIAKIRITFVATHSASGKIIQSTAEIRKGNAAILIQFADSSAVVTPDEKWLIESAVTAPESARKKRSKRPFARVGGSAALQFYRLSDETENRLDFSQTTARLNLTARQIGGKPLKLRIRTRSRHNRRARDYFANNIPGNEFRYRVYEFSLAYRDPQKPLGIRLGRLYSMRLSGLGYIDGGEISYKIFTNFSAGIVAGTPPQLRNSAFQTARQKYGIYLDYAAKKSLAMTLAAVTESGDSTVNRRFIYLQTRFQKGGKLQFFQSLELDVNRNSQRASNAQSVALSNLFISTRFRISGALSADITFDNRRIDYTLENANVSGLFFENDLRTGLRGNLLLTLSPTFSVFGSVDFRRWESQNNQIVHGFSGGISKTNLLTRQLSLHLNGTSFSSLFSKGVTGVARFSWQFTGGHRFEARYLRYDYTINGVALDRSNELVSLASQWVGWQHVVLSGQFEFSRGDDLNGKRLLLSLGYVF